jgi:hypothetical protein
MEKVIEITQFEQNTFVVCVLFPGLLLQLNRTVFFAEDEVHKFIFRKKV